MPIRHGVVPASLIVTLLAAAAGAEELLPVAASDLAAATLIAAAAPAEAKSVPREAVALSWPLAAAAELEPLPQPFTSRSKEYFVDVTGDDLRRGVTVYTSQPGALVRLNPAAGDAAAGPPEKAAIEPAALVLNDPSGRSHGAGSGMDLAVGADQLAAAGAPFAAGTSAFRIRDDLGAGAFTLRAEDLGAASASRYVMHVLDQNSDVELELRTLATDYLHGQTLIVEAALAGQASGLRTRRIEGFVTSPAGRAWPLSFRAAGGGVHRATLQLDAVEAPAPGLWQVHASAQGHTAEHALLRAARTAFACSVPSARFSAASELSVSDRGLTLNLGVEAASASRYEARAVLYGTAADGTLRPAGIAHTAAWIEAGHGSLALTFGREILAGVEAPFELRDLRLIDQVSMSLLHRQSRALEIGR